MLVCAQIAQFFFFFFFFFTFFVCLLAGFSLPFLFIFYTNKSHLNYCPKDFFLVLFYILFYFTFFACLVLYFYKKKKKICKNLTGEGNWCYRKPLHDFCIIFFLSFSFFASFLVICFIRVFGYFVCECIHLMRDDDVAFKFLNSQSFCYFPKFFLSQTYKASEHKFNEKKIWTYMVLSILAVRKVSYLRNGRVKVFIYRVLFWMQ